MRLYMLNHVAKLAGLATFALVLFVGVVTWQTVFSADLPMVTANESATAKRLPQFVAVTYSREIQVERPFVAHVSRYIVQNSTGEQIVVPGAIETYKAGKTRIVRTFLLPPEIAPGEWCLQAVVAWVPFMSMATRYYEPPPACFVLQPQKGAAYAPVT